MSTSPKNITAIILSGGKSSRMGQDKGLIKIKDKPMVQYAIEAVKPFCEHIMLLSNQVDYDVFGVDVYTDKVKDIGPMGGIYTGLKESKTDLNLVLTCDSPFVDETIVEGLINDYQNGIDAFYCNYAANKYPLTAIYSKRILPKIEAAIAAKNYRVRDLFNTANSKPYELSLSNYEKLLNVNTTEELKEII